MDLEYGFFLDVTKIRLSPYPEVEDCGGCCNWSSFCGRGVGDGFGSNICVLRFRSRDLSHFGIFRIAD